MGLIPGQGTKISHGTQCDQKKKQKQQQQKLVARDPYQEPHCIVLASVAEEAEGSQ